jgi:phosphoribosyl-dephospho-CoA transferase
MEVNPHDLIRIKGHSYLVTDVQEPEWVKVALTQAPYVVVRRAPMEKGYIPVGVRGHHRHERFAAFLPQDAVIEIITPEQLVTQKQWKQSSRYYVLPILQALDDIYEVFQLYDLVWGPVGSVGFELVSGIPTVKDTSDLDIVVRLPHFPSIETARQLVAELTRIPIRMDVQLEIPAGAVSLLEYSQGSQLILLKSVCGPKLISHPYR